MVLKSLPWLSFVDLYESFSSFVVLCVVVLYDTGLDPSIGIGKLKRSRISRGLINYFVEFPSVLATAPKFRYKIIVAKRGEEEFSRFVIGHG